MANGKKLHTNIAKARLYRKKVDTRLQKYENRYMHADTVRSSDTIVKRNLHIDVNTNYKGKKRLHIYTQYDTHQQQRSGVLNRVAHVYEHISINGKQLHSYQPESKIGNVVKFAAKSPLYAEKAYLAVRNTHRVLNKPYELHYYNTRVYDAETGKYHYEHKFKIKENTKRPYVQSGVLHKLDYIARKRIHSDKPLIKHKSLHNVTQTAWKTALSTETAAAATATITKNRVKYASIAKLRQEAQDDASKGAVKVGGTTAAAVIATASHFNQKRINKPYLLAEKARQKQEKSIKKIAKHTAKSQKKAYKRTHKLDEKYFKKTGRHLKIDENIKPVKKVRKTKLEKKTIKSQKKQHNINNKLFKLRNKSLISKAGAASAFKIKG